MCHVFINATMKEGGVFHWRSSDGFMGYSKYSTDASASNSVGAAALVMTLDLSRKNPTKKKKKRSIFQLLNKEHVQLGLATLTSIPCASPQTQQGVRTHRFSTLYNSINDILLLGALKGQRGCVFGWSRKCYMFRLHYLTHASLTLRAEATLQRKNKSRQPNISQRVWEPACGGGVTTCKLECVASRGRFVVFVALQGERRNANVKVGAVSPFNTKRPPKNK